MPRIYVVTDSNIQPVPEGGSAQHHFLVMAESQAQAINVVVSDRYSAKAATSADVADLMGQGLKVLSAKKLPEIVPAAV